MIVLNKKPWLTGMALMAGAVMHVSAADFIWTGGAGDGNWSSGANWQGGAPPVGGSHTLHFTGDTGLNTINDTLAGVTGLVFGPGAGAFTLAQDSLILGGNIVNNSTTTQTINLDLSLNSHRMVDTKHGDVILSGAVTAPSAFSRLDKLGRGTLELRGANTFAGRSHIYRGTYLLDASTGSLANSDLYFGNDTFEPYLSNNGTLVVKGANYSFGGTVAVINGAANTVRPEGIALTINRYTVPSSGTMNFDISQAGSSIAVANAPTLFNDQLAFTTVTDGVKTGFAALSGSNIVRRDSASLDVLPSSLSVETRSYRTSGATTMTASQTVHALTITGGGSLTGGAAVAMRFREMLMEEGVGDYRISLTRIGHNDNINFHQYSRSGTLIIDSQILLGNTLNSVNKTGDGTMWITDSSVSSYRGLTRVQAGRLELDGQITQTSTLMVYDRAVLAGGGKVGGLAASIVEIRGGRLEATTSRALEIDGTLNFTWESELSFLLDGVGDRFVDVSGAITIGEGINLDLVLGSAPTPEWELILLQGESITGEFATVNGEIVGPDGFFNLSYASTNYTFELFNTGTEIGLRAIPEPSMVGLLGAGAGLLLLRRRRR